MITAARALPTVVAAALVAAFVWTGLRGIDFGEHWDEQTLVNRVKWSVVNGGTLLPGSYDWPSIAYWLALGSLVPEITVPRAGDPSAAAALETRLVTRLDAPDYRRRLRRVFLIATSLVLVWLYLAASTWTGSSWSGVAAAGVAAGSWQFAYHARWAAPDGLVVQFVALTLLGAVRTRTHATSPAGPLIAAVAGGLAVGSKYTAWPFAVAWLVSDAAWRFWNAQPWRRPALRGAALMTGAFLLSTPGALLQPFRFVASLAYLRQHYSSDATVLAPYVVGSGGPMLTASMTYIFAVLASPWLPLALLVAALAMTGVMLIARRDPTLVILVAGGPILLVSSMSLQPVLLVRNLLPLVAVVAFSAAIALAGLCTRLPRWRPAIGAAAAVVVSAHLAFLWRAADTIGSPDLAVRIYQAEYAGLCASAAVAESITVAGLTAPRICSDPPRALMPWETGLFPPPAIARPRVLGPLDVDALYYPNWLASQHIVITR